MNIDLEKWLSQLPIVEEEIGHGILLNGWLVPGEIDQISIIVGELRLSFFSSDVVETKSVGSTEHLPPSAGVPIRLVVRRGAPILDICLERPSEGFSQQRRPFALSVRPPTIIRGPSNKFRDLERQFLQSHSLIDP